MYGIISAEGICAGYGGVEVISGLSFTVSRGEVLAVLGPNGSGKTTLLKAVLGIIPLSGGELRVFGKGRLSAAEAEKLISYIPQRLEIDRTFPISLSEMLALSGGGAALDRYIDMLELRALLDRKVGELSGGQFQRALLAYSIIKEPLLLIMDEPTSWVDVKGSDCLLCAVEELKKKGIAIIMVSHDFSVLGAVCTHVLGLGPDQAFFEPADSPELEEKIKTLMGATHPVHD
jgi:ABC-type Mn2+/Zn2+ transport system ATPase subunit